MPAIYDPPEAEEEPTGRLVERAPACRWQAPTELPSVMHLPREAESAKKAVLLLVDEQSAGTDFGDSLVRLVLRHWRAMLIGAIAGAVVAITYVLLVPKWYRAQTVVAVVSQESNGSLLNSLSNQLGGLTALAGINLDEGENFEAQVIARLTSRAFVYDFLTEQQLLPVLFASKWDAASGRWRAARSEPTLEDAYRYFLENVLQVTQDRSNGLVRIAIDWKEPALASTWANTLVARINMDVRGVERTNAERNLEFLNRELEKTNIIELREAINRLVESEIRKLMLVNVREQYAFKVIDPAFTPGPKGVVRPRRAIVAGLGTAAGALLGLLVALWATFRTSRGRRDEARG